MWRGHMPPKSFYLHLEEWKCHQLIWESQWFSVRILGIEFQPSWASDVPVTSNCRRQVDGWTCRSRVLGRLRDAIWGQRRRGGTVTRQTRGVVISKKGRGSPDSRSGFFGGVALKLMQKESRNGDSRSDSKGRLAHISLPVTHQAFVVELGKFVTGCQMSLTSF